MAGGSLASCPLQPPVSPGRLQTRRWVSAVDGQAASRCSTAVPSLAAGCYTAAVATLLGKTRILATRLRTTAEPPAASGPLERHSGCIVARAATSPGPCPPTEQFGKAHMLIRLGPAARTTVVACLPSERPVLPVNPTFTGARLDERPPAGGEVRRTAAPAGSELELSPRPAGRSTRLDPEKLTFNAASKSSGSPVQRFGNWHTPTIASRSRPSCA